MEIHSPERGVLAKPIAKKKVQGRRKVSGQRKDWKKIAKRSVQTRSSSTQSAEDSLTLFPIFVLDFIVEVFDALGHLLLVDGVIDIEVVQIGVALVCLSIFVQFSCARHGSAVRAFPIK